jgi:hypothetical protein
MTFRMLICSVAIALASTACRKSSNVDASQQAIIGDELMLALAQAKNFHHKANVLIADGKPDAAITTVREILALRFPSQAPEGEDVRNDARALLAKLLASQGKLDDATAVIGEGLATATRDSFFVANLYTVQGEVHQARAELLAKDADKKPQADIERRAAITAFDRSIAINTVLQQQLESHKP